MKKITLICFVFLFSQNAFSANWYIGAGGGVSKSQDASSNLDADQNALANVGISTSVSANQGSGDIAVFGGYKFNRNVSAEAGFDYLGKYTLNAAAAGGGGTITGTQEEQVSAVSASLLLSAPLTPTFSVFGKLGVANSTTKMTCSISNSPCQSTTDSKSGGIIGIGGDIASGSSFIRVEIDQLQSVGNKDNDYTAGSFNIYKIEGVFPIL